MTLLCFLLDIRTIPPSLLRDLKQVKISYSPKGNFNLRNFHHAVNNLPSESFLMGSNSSDHNDISTPDVMLPRVISDESLYLRNDKDIMKKVICVGCSLIKNSENLRKTLMEAAERCISVEFVILESDRFHGFSEEMEKLVNSITDMENCTIQSFVPSAYILSGLVKKWFQDMNNDAEEPTQAIFHFKTGIIGTTNQIFCNIFPTCKVNLEDIKQSLSCRCHGIPVTNRVRAMTNRPHFCRASGRALEASELIENALMVGGQTLLHMPSFHSFPQLSEKTFNPVNFHVIERTKLASLDEGAILGGSHMVTPAASLESESATDELDGADLNNQAFYGLSRCLSLSDQGLVCTSTCNTETMKHAPFQYFYLLLPSNNGTMLLRRLAASEEIWPIPETAQAGDVTLPEELLTSIQKSLSKVDLRDYNPLHHDRGFHQRLNSLVKESLHPGSIPPENAEGEEDALDEEKTSRILERLEMPGPKKGMGALPTIVTSRVQKAHGPPSVPGPIQPLRPIFQRLKRAHR
ncbi:uncharacterized protein LOC144704172 isoform X2 [Wolffia australiana]